MISHFEPYFDGTFSESYNQDFYNLLLSIVFRTLSYIAAGPETNRITGSILALVEAWRMYLDRGVPLAYKGLYAVRHHELELIPGWHTRNRVWMGQGVYASSPNQSEARYFVHAQMGPFHVFADLGEIDEKGTPIDASWAQFEVAQTDGSFSTIGRIPKELQYILSESDLLFSQKVETLSEAQLEKIRLAQEKHSSRLQELGLK